MILLGLVSKPDRMVEMTILKAEFKVKGDWTVALSFFLAFCFYLYLTSFYSCLKEEICRQQYSCFCFYLFFKSIKKISNNNSSNILVADYTISEWTTISSLSLFSPTIIFLFHTLVLKIICPHPSQIISLIHADFAEHTRPCPPYP